MMKNLFYLLYALVGFLIPGNALATNKPYIVGMASAYTYKVNNTTISVPIEFPTDLSGVLIDWTEKSYNFLPDKFVVGNGTVLRSFLEIDKSPGSILNLQLKQIKLDILGKLNSKNSSDISAEKVLNHLAKHIGDYLTWLPKEEQVSLFKWDRNLSDADSLNYDLADERRQLFGIPKDNFLIATESHFSVPFERVLSTKKGFCIDMALLASFILETFQIPHRIVFGSILQNDSTGLGHTWIELPDGRILDVAWETLDFPGFNENTFHKDWLWFGNAKGYQYRYEYEFFPIIKH